MQARTRQQVTLLTPAGVPASSLNLEVRTALYGLDFGLLCPCRTPGEQMGDMISETFVIVLFLNYFVMFGVLPTG